MSNNTSGIKGNAPWADVRVVVDDKGYVAGLRAPPPAPVITPAPKAIDMRIKTASNGMIIELYPPNNDSPNYRVPSVVRVVTDMAQLGDEITTALIEAKLLETNT